MASNAGRSKSAMASVKGSLGCDSAAAVRSIARKQMATDLEKHLYLKWNDGFVGNITYDFLTSRRVFKRFMIPTIPNARYLDSALERCDKLKRKSSSSPKIDKTHCPGDDEPLDDVSSPIWIGGIGIALI